MTKSGGNFRKMTLVATWRMDLPSGRAVASCTRLHPTEPRQAEEAADPTATGRQALRETSTIKAHSCLPFALFSLSQWAIPSHVPRKDH